MATLAISVSAEENLGDPIDIRMDIINPEPVVAVAFPAAAVVRTQAQHEEAIRGLRLRRRSRILLANARDRLVSRLSSSWLQCKSPSVRTENFRKLKELMTIATACYVLNRVLVTKPNDKTPYELLTRDKPFISYLKPFGCHVTILNTSDPLGKFDKKSNKGYIVGYSSSSKAYRIHNLVSRKIEETMNLKFLENKPFVVGTGQAWMFDIDYLTNSLNYSRVSSTNLTAGSQGASPFNAVVPIVDEATTQNDGTKSDPAKINADNLDELAELHALQRQEQARTKEADRLGLVFPSLNPILGVGSASIGSSVSAGSTPPISAGSTPPMSPCASPIFADRHSIFAGKSHVPAGRPTSSAVRLVSIGRPTGSAGRPVTAGRPSGSAARTPVPTGRILGKFTASASSKRFPRASSVKNSDIHDDGKRAIGTKWILKNKRDARGIVCRNKVRLVAQGHRQEERIGYTDVFAP
nr:putative ribonuclease H-like domain-containing protein [Tanacetum cinerariifolium]